MDSAGAAEYSTADPDPVTPRAARAIEHLNTDHADGLADMARTWAATGRRFGVVHRHRSVWAGPLNCTPPGDAYTWVGFGERLDSAEQLRSVTAALVRRARI